MQQQALQGNLTSSLSVVAVEEDNSRINRLKFMSADFVDGLLNHRNIVIAKEVKNISKEIGYSPEQVALNWIRQQNTLHKMKNKIIPIVSARKDDQIDDDLGCL
jgi:aryl-alcohol dehydrogenase-like predicted oxidoreductase